MIKSKSKIQNSRKSNAWMKQVPRGYIRCNFFVVSLFMMSFDDFLPSETTIIVVQKKKKNSGQTD